MKRNVLIIGAGGVAHVAAHKCAEFSEQFGEIHIASIRIPKCNKIIDNIREKKGALIAKKFTAHTLDATNIEAVIQLILKTKSKIVINLGSSYINMSILQACIKTSAAYIDTSVHEDPNKTCETPPLYQNYEWKLKDDCSKLGIAAILGAGFDPGVVNAYAALAQEDYFDSIESIDILDVNAGKHNQYFATNFNPEINLREFIETVWCWQNNAWVASEMFQTKKNYDFPVVGSHDVYLTGHEEIHSLSHHLNIPNIRFWMGFSAHYINVFTVLKNLGLLSIHPIKTAEGYSIVPLQFIKAILPDPATLAEKYIGKTCIGNHTVGYKDGIKKEIFIYNIACHEKSYHDVGGQAISYTAAIPAVAAALLIAEGVWDVHHMVNVENLPPKPFVKKIAELGLDTFVRDEHGIDFNSNFIFTH